MGTFTFGEFHLPYFPLLILGDVPLFQQRYPLKTDPVGDVPLFHDATLFFCHCQDPRPSQPPVVLGKPLEKYSSTPGGRCRAAKRRCSESGSFRQVKRAEGMLWVRVLSWSLFVLRLLKGNERENLMLFGGGGLLLTHTYQFVWESNCSVQVAELLRILQMGELLANGSYFAQGKPKQVGHLLLSAVLLSPKTSCQQGLKG